MTTKTNDVQVCGYSILGLEVYILYYLKATGTIWQFRQLLAGSAVLRAGTLEVATFPDKIMQPDEVAGFDEGQLRALEGFVGVG